MEYFKGVTEKVESKMNEKCMVCSLDLKKGDRVTQVLMGVYGTLHVGLTDPSEGEEFGIGVAVILEAHSECVTVSIPTPTKPSIN